MSRPLGTAAPNRLTRWMARHRRLMQGIYATLALLSVVLLVVTLVDEGWSRSASAFLLLSISFTISFFTARTIEATVERHDAEHADA